MYALRQRMVGLVRRMAETRDFRLVPLFLLVVMQLFVLGCLPYGSIAWLVASCLLRYIPLEVSEPALGEQISANAAQHRVDLFIELDVAGVFTPTASSATGGPFAAGIDLLSDELVYNLMDNGYIAVRVPHAPPDYQPSQLIAGHGDSDPDSQPFIFTYYSPPNASTATSVNVPLSRRDEYLAIVNARFPISDGRSHWEVWWLPKGQRFPIPAAPFQLKAGIWPTAFRVRFALDFGVGASGICAGCPIEYAFWNGYAFVGPYRQTLRLTDPPYPAGSPLADFGTHCGQPSFYQVVSPTVSFTHTFWLENYDAAPRTFTITADSALNWDYTYYYQLPSQSAPVKASGLPFAVTAPANVGRNPSCVEIMVVGAPPVDASHLWPELLTVTATCASNLDLHPSTQSIASVFAGPATTLRRLYLPLARRP